MTGYHGLRDAEKNLHSRFADLYSGAITETRLSTPEPYALLDYFNAEPDKLVAAFDKILEKIKIRGQRELRGEWQGVVPEAQKAVDAAGAIVADVKSSASSLVGYEAEPTNVIESASSVAKVAQASASSFAQAAASAMPSVAAPEELVSAVKSAAAEASQQVLRRANIEPSPTDLKQTATYVARAASSSVLTAAAAASQSIVRAVGGDPSPTDLPQSASSIAKVASSSASSIASRVASEHHPSSSLSSAIAAASQTVNQVASEASRSASSLASSASNIVSSVAAPASSVLDAASFREVSRSASERAGDVLGGASQGVLRAVGIEPSPTDVKQSVSSVGKAASSAVSSAASAVSSFAAPHSSFRAATQSPNVVVAAAASSLASSASSVASSLAQPHSSYSKSRAVAGASSATRAVKQEIRHVEL